MALKTSVFSVLIGAVAVFTTAPAFAEDAVLATETSTFAAQTTSNPWTGFYVGGHAGWIWDQADWSFAQNNWWGEPGDAQSLDSDGFLGGGQAGYMHQLQNNFVLGVDLSASYTDINRSVRSDRYFACCGDTWTVDIDWLLLAQARVGYAGDRYLLFLQGGYAGADVSASAFPISGGGTASESFWNDGWTIGAGFSYLATDNISFGVEYNYVDLNTRTYNLQSGGDPDYVNVDHDLHAAKLTVNFHFGGR